MFSLNSNLMSWIILDWIWKIFSAIFDFISEIIRIILDYLMKPIYMIFLGVCKLLDLFELIAKKLAGMDVVYVNGTAVSGDLTLSLLNNGTIWKAFAAMLALGSLLLFVTTFIAVVKSQMATGAKSSVKIVVSNFIRSLVNFAIVPALCFAGIYFGNALLKALDAATNQTGANTVSGAVFLCASYDANRARDPSSKLYEEYLSAGAEKSDKNTCGGAFSDSNSNGTAAVAVDNYFVQQKVVDNCVLEFNILHKILLGSPYAGTASNITGYIPLLNAIDTSDKMGSDIFTREGNSKITFTYYNVSLVCIYYNLASFNYFIGIGAGIILLFAYLDLIFGLIKRLYMLVTLFVISPPIIALYPLDEGRAFNGWKQQFIGNTISAYSAVVCMNIYLMLMGVFQTVTLFADTSSNAINANEITYVEAAEEMTGTQALANLGIQLANELCQTFIIIGGAMFFKQMVGEVSRIVGANDAMGEGSAVAKQMQNKVKKVATTAAAVAVTGGAAVAAKGAATMKKAKALNDRRKAYKAIKDGKDTADKATGKGALKDSSPQDKGDTKGAKNDAANNDAANNEKQSLENQQKEMDDVDQSMKKSTEENEKEIKQDSSKLKNAMRVAKTGVKHTVGAAVNPLGAIGSGIKGIDKRLHAKRAKKSGASDEQIARIEKEYNDKIRAANAYNPIKNPIKARMRGLQERFRGKYLMGGMSGMDRNAAYEYYMEQSGRKDATKARVQELREDYRLQKTLGNDEATKEARTKLHNYLNTMKNLQRDDAHWQQEAAFQKQIQSQTSKLESLMVELRMAQKNSGDTSKIEKQIAEANRQLAEINKVRK